MAQFSRHSKQELRTCHPDLRAVLNRGIRVYNFRVVEGHRGQRRQNRLYRQGKSQLQWPQSKHNENPSLAADLAPWPINWNDQERFYLMAGHLLMAAHQLRREGRIDHDLRWGGDWDGDGKLDDQQFDDLPHVELVKS